MLLAAKHISAKVMFCCTTCYSSKCPSGV